MPFFRLPSAASREPGFPTETSGQHLSPPRGQCAPTGNTEEEEIRGGGQHDQHGDDIFLSSQTEPAQEDHGNYEHARDQKKDSRWGSGLSKYSE